MERVVKEGEKMLLRVASLLSGDGEETTLEIEWGVGEGAVVLLARYSS